MKKLLALLCTLALLLTLAVPAFAVELRTDASDYKILLIADPQDDEDPAEDMTNLIRTAIAKTQPDLIVCLGDMVEDSDVAKRREADGTVTELPYEEIYKNCEQALAFEFAPIIESGIPYTTVIGNNDYQSGITAQDWYRLVSALPGIILPERIVNSEGRIDNMFAVRNADGTEALRIFTMDTGKKGVTNEQIEWFEKTNDDRSIPALVFQHVPMKEIGYLFKTCFPWDEGAIKKDGIYKRLNTKIAVGNNNGELENAGHTAQFRSIRKCGNVIGVFSGHVHDISMEGTYSGVRMGLVYSDRWNGNYQHGAALLTFDKADMRRYTVTQYRYSGTVADGDAALEIEEPLSYPAPKGFAYIRYEWQLMCAYLQEKIDAIFH